MAFPFNSGLADGFYTKVVIPISPRDVLTLSHHAEATSEYQLLYPVQTHPLSPADLHRRRD